jgi:hypothetical protein
MPSTHHCPKQKKGGCRKGHTTSGAPYCTTHQTYCKVPSCNAEYPFLLNQQCNTCKGNAARLKAKKEAEKKAQEKARKEAKEAAKKSWKGNFMFESVCIAGELVWVRIWAWSI